MDYTYIYKLREKIFYFFEYLLGFVNFKILDTDLPVINFNFNKIFSATFQFSIVRLTIVITFSSLTFLSWFYRYALQLTQRFHLFNLYILKYLFWICFNQSLGSVFKTELLGKCSIILKSGNLGYANNYIYSHISTWTGSDSKLGKPA